MAITYTWDIKILDVSDRNNFRNAVVNCFWKKTGTDENGISGVYHGGTTFSTAEIDPSSFVEFENLTKEIVISWIESSINSEDINNHISQDILNKSNPIVEKTLPWETSNT
jgi:hypothetical protein